MARFALFIVFVALKSDVVSAVGVNAQWGKIVDQCEVKGAKGHLWILKQWHLSPKVNTHKDKGQWPQQENQKAIFKQLDAWIKNGDLKSVYSEGCEGEVTDNFKPEFNGWTMKDLIRESQKPDFDDLLTLIPMKIKARYHDKVKVLCGDDTSIINGQSQALSDIRGNAGFLSRITQYKNDETRLKPYLDKVKELDHLPSNASADSAISRLREDIDKELKVYKDGLVSRNKKFVDHVEGLVGEGALVVGGLHAKGLMEILKTRGIDCTVIEPQGYSSEDEDKITNFLK